MKILCTICMRKGSKGIRNKNLTLIKGKPLLYYTINQAIKSGIFDHVVVSTNSARISKLSRKFGASSWFKRPLKYSGDKSPKLPAIRHAFLQSEKFFNTKFDILIDLDATSPLRKVSDIKNALNLLIKEQSHNLISASESRKNPYFNIIEYKNNKLKVVKGFKSLKRRQDAPKTYDMNASIYIWRRHKLLNSDIFFDKKTSLYLMPQNRSIDIDSKEDLELVKFLMNKRKI